MFCENTKTWKDSRLGQHAGPVKVFFSSSSLSIIDSQTGMQIALMTLLCIDSNEEFSKHKNA